MFASQHNGLTVVGQIVIAVILTLLLAAAVGAQPGSSESSSKPWWKQEKIRFFWGYWTPLEEAEVPWEQTMANLARAGATVFVDHSTWEGWTETDHYNLDRARLAQEYGIRYFGLLNVAGLHAFAAQMQAPLAVDERGEYPGGAHTPCPLHRPLYEQWFVRPMLEAAQSELVDGFHMDWEAYGGRGEAGTCYCDDCFRAFLNTEGLTLDDPVPKDQRHSWLESRKLLDRYVAVFEQRRTEMFASFARRIHQAKPDFIFSAYNIWDCPLTRGLHTPQAPFFIIDVRHYWEDHTRPWWDSCYAYHHKLGMRHIAGSWDNALFGGQPQSNVSATQWMYDAAINSDGYWLWFEEELTPDAWRSFWIANRRIRATEAQVGEFLLDGNQDIHFVTPVEWSGNPEFDRKIIQRTYHLGDEHLVHLHNVDTDRPMRLRLRFPRLRAESRWLVTDPMVDLTYVHDGGKVIWTGQQLRDGIGLCLEKRSELFVKLAPAQTALPGRAVATIASDEARPMPSHADAAASAEDISGSAPGEEPAGGPAVGRLVYTVTETLGYLGSQGGWAIGNAIHTIDVDGTNHSRLRQLKGYLWSPAWSPDGRRIAFTHYANGRGQIYVMNDDGTGAVNLSSNHFCDRAPVWSPDGSKLAFVSGRDGDWEIFVMNADGSGQRQITHSPGWDRAPVWSPDGKRIAFETNRGGDWDIYLISASGLGERPVIHGPGQHRESAWSPDGTLIACHNTGHHMRDLVVATTDGTNLRKLVEQVPDLDSLCWSPDGQYLAAAFRGPQERDRAGIFTIQVEGPDNRRLTDVQKLIDVPALPPRPGGGRRPFPSWYSSGGASPRWVVKTIGGLCWSPDGGRLAFSSDMADDGYFYVYVVARDGEKPVKLQDTASAWPQQVSWSPQ